MFSAKPKPTADEEDYLSCLMSETPPASPTSQPARAPKPDLLSHNLSVHTNNQHALSKPSVDKQNTIHPAPTQIARHKDRLTTQLPDVPTAQQKTTKPTARCDVDKLKSTNSTSPTPSSPQQSILSPALSALLSSTPTLVSSPPVLTVDSLSWAFTSDQLSHLHCLSELTEHDTHSHTHTQTQTSPTVSGLAEDGLELLMQYHHNPLQWATRDSDSDTRERETESSQSRLDFSPINMAAQRHNHSSPTTETGSVLSRVLTRLQHKDPHVIALVQAKIQQTWFPALLPSHLTNSRVYAQYQQYSDRLRVFKRYSAELSDLSRLLDKYLHTLHAATTACNHHSESTKVIVGECEVCLQSQRATVQQIQVIHSHLSFYHESRTIENNLKTIRMLPVIKDQLKAGAVCRYVNWGQEYLTLFKLCHVCIIYMSSHTNVPAAKQALLTYDQLLSQTCQSLLQTVQSCLTHAYTTIDGLKHNNTHTTGVATTTTTTTTPLTPGVLGLLSPMRPRLVVDDPDAHIRAQYSLYNTHTLLTTFSDKAYSELFDIVNIYRDVFALVELYAHMSLNLSTTKQHTTTGVVSPLNTHMSTPVYGAGFDQTPPSSSTSSLVTSNVTNVKTLVLPASQQQRLMSLLFELHKTFIQKRTAVVTRDLSLYYQQTVGSVDYVSVCDINTHTHTFTLPSLKTNTLHVCGCDCNTCGGNSVCGGDLEQLQRQANQFPHTLVTLRNQSDMSKSPHLPSSSSSSSKLTLDRWLLLHLDLTVGVLQRELLLLKSTFTVDMYSNALLDVFTSTHPAFFQHTHCVTCQDSKLTHTNHPLQGVSPLVGALLGKVNCSHHIRDHEHTHTNTHNAKKDRMVVSMSCTQHVYSEMEGGMLAVSEALYTHYTQHVGQLLKSNVDINQQTVNAMIATLQRQQQSVSSVCLVEGCVDAKDAEQVSLILGLISSTSLANLNSSGLAKTTVHIATLHNCMCVLVNVFNLLATKLELVGSGGTLIDVEKNLANKTQLSVSLFPLLFPVVYIHRMLYFTKDKLASLYNEMFAAYKVALTPAVSHKLMDLAWSSVSDKSGGTFSHIARNTSIPTKGNIALAVSCIMQQASLAVQKQLLHLLLANTDCIKPSTHLVSETRHNTANNTSAAFNIANRVALCTLSLLNKVLLSQGQIVTLPFTHLLRTLSQIGVYYEHKHKHNLFIQLEKPLIDMIMSYKHDYLSFLNNYISTASSPSSPSQQSSSPFITVVFDEMFSSSAAVLALSVSEQRVVRTKQAIKTAMFVHQGLHSSTKTNHALTTHNSQLHLQLSALQHASFIHATPHIDAVSTTIPAPIHADLGECGVLSLVGGVVQAYDLSSADYSVFVEHTNPLTYTHPHANHIPQSQTGWSFLSLPFLSSPSSPSASTLASLFKDSCKQAFSALFKWLLAGVHEVYMSVWTQQHYTMLELVHMNHRALLNDERSVVSLSKALFHLCSEHDVTVWVCENTPGQSAVVSMSIFAIRLHNVLYSMRVYIQHNTHEQALRSSMLHNIKVIVEQLVKALLQASSQASPSYVTTLKTQGVEFSVMIRLLETILHEANVMMAERTQ